VGSAGIRDGRWEVQEQIGECDSRAHFELDGPQEEILVGISGQIGWT